MRGLKAGQGAAAIDEHGRRQQQEQCQDLVLVAAKPRMPAAASVSSAVAEYNIRYGWRESSYMCSRLSKNAC
jgi:hypothetical protein